MRSVQCPVFGLPKLSNMGTVLLGEPNVWLNLPQSPGARAKMPVIAIC